VPPAAAALLMLAWERASLPKIGPYLRTAQYLGYDLLDSTTQSLSHSPVTYLLLGPANGYDQTYLGVRKGKIPSSHPQMGRTGASGSLPGY